MTNSAHVKEVLPRLPADERFVLGDQLRRAMNSVILNIAEGSYRKSDKDFAHFLNQAQTSLYEVVSCFDLMEDSGYVTASTCKEFTSQLEDLAKQISAFSKTLHNK